MNEVPSTPVPASETQPPAGSERSRLEYGLTREPGPPALFAVAYTAVGSSVYVALGVIAGHALGLTPVVMMAVGVLFVITAMTYTEGAVLHPERGGSSVFARYAFNELWSFVAAWAILLDLVIVVAITALAVPHYLAGLAAGAGRGDVDVLIALGVVATVALLNVRGFKRDPRRRWAELAVVDFIAQLLVICVGVVLIFNPDLITRHVELGITPTWHNAIFAATVAALAIMGIEAASNLAPEVEPRGSSLRQVMIAGSVAVFILYIGISVVALMAVPVEVTASGYETALGDRFVEAPVLGVVMSFDVQWVAEILRYLIAVVAVVVLFLATNAAMLGISRLSYSLATNRQIPGVLARLHPTRSTPYVVVFAFTLFAAALVVPGDVNLLAGIFAFGVMIALTLAHLSICVLRFKEPDQPRPYRVPLSLRVGHGSIPIPAVLGAVVSFSGWLSVAAFQPSARLVGGIWMAAGIVLYVVYRLMTGMSITEQVKVPDAALQEVPEVGFGSILVPVFGTDLDDDIVGTAGRLAAESKTKDGGAVMRVVYVVEIPTTLPLGASLSGSQIQVARRALNRAREVGEEYERVEVVIELIRARSTGAAIVEEARRRNVEVIVLGGEEPTRIKGGPLLGGIGGRRVPFVGKVTEYVVRRAPCRVVLTAPPAAGGIGEEVGSEQ